MMWKKRKILSIKKLIIISLVFIIVVCVPKMINASSGNDRVMTVYDLNTHISDGTIITSPSTRNVIKKEYTGNPIKPTFNIKINIPQKGINYVLKEGTHYRLKYPNYEDITNVSSKIHYGSIEAKSLITGIESFRYIIVARNIRQAQFGTISKQIYTGKSITPDVAINYNGKRLKKNTDYTLSYKNNLKVGTASVTVKGKGNFKGEKTINFQILSRVQNCSISKSSITLGIGETFTVTGSFSPNGYFKDKWFDSNNSNVAWVDRKSGKITASREGTTNINFKVNNGINTFWKSCKVTVKKAPNWIKLNASSIKLGQGEAFTLRESTNSGSYANASNLKWEVKDSSGKVINKSTGTNNKYIKADTKGTYSVTVRTYNNKTATCKLQVYAAPSKISLSNTNITLKIGETKTIKHFTNSGSYSNYFEWQIGNTNIAKLIDRNANQYKIKGIREGKTTFKVKTYNGKSATCTINVVSKESEERRKASQEFAKKLLSVADEMHTYMEKAKYEYCDKGGSCAHVHNKCNRN